MQHPYQILRTEYEADLAGMRVLKPLQVNDAARALLLRISLYQLEQQRTGVPAAFLAALDWRESNADPSCGLGQGDPWDRMSRHVPRGKGPFMSKLEADVFYIKYDHLDDNSAPWTWSYVCWKGEAWNGFGPRNRGIRTGYLWAGTSLYSRGKYIADGQWDAGAVDQQLGIIPVMRRLIGLNPNLAFDNVIAHDHIATEPAPPQPTPEGVGGGWGAHNTRWVQQALNDCYLLLADALQVDGSYGRRTREAVRSFQRFNKLMPDGLFGVQTDKALTAALEQHQRGMA